MLSSLLIVCFIVGQGFCRFIVVCFQFLGIFPRPVLSINIGQSLFSVFRGFSPKSPIDKLWPKFTSSFFFVLPTSISFHIDKH